MSVRRAAAFTAMLCAIAVGSLALPWFRADLPGRDVVVSAPEVSPVSWLIAPLALVIVILVLRASRRGELTAAVAWRSLVGAVAAAVTACAIALAAALFPAVSVRAVGIPDAPQVPVEHLPASFVAAGAFAGIASLLCSWLIGLANAIEDGNGPSDLR
jgi:cytochrome bd-type quinol oxidase subunit 2